MPLSRFRVNLGLTGPLNRIGPCWPVFPFGMGGHVACLNWSVEDVSVIDTWQAPIGLREGHVAEPGWSTCQTVIGG